MYTCADQSCVYYATHSLKLAYSDCCSYNRSQMLLSTNVGPICFYLGRLMLLTTQNHKIPQNQQNNCDWAIRAD